MKQNTFKSATSLLTVFAVLAVMVSTSACSFSLLKPSAFQTYYQALSATQATLKQVSSNAADVALYKSQINAVIASYNVAEAAFQAGYAAKTSDLTTLNSDVAALVDQVAILVGQFAPQALAVRFSPAAHFKKRATPQVSLQDIETILQIAETAATTLSASSPYAALAALILQAAQVGIAAFENAGSAAINPAALQPIPLLQ